MRIYGPNGLGTVAAPVARRSPGAAFSLEEPGAAHSAGTAAAPRALGGIDALIALQSVDDPAEKRRRGLKRGRNALDALEALKLGLLSGRLDQAALGRLKTAAAELAEPSGDPALDAILGQIGLRVNVELAKAGMPNSR